MPRKPHFNWRRIGRWTLWVLIAQLVLANISAALYAWRFTHFLPGPTPAHVRGNIFETTWRLFSGPRFYKTPLAASPAFAHENLRLHTADGDTIRGWYAPADPRKPCVLFFHGLTVNRDHLLAEATNLQSWGYPVLLVDFRGHGESDGRSTSFGVKETEEVRLATAYARSKGHTKTVLYGASLGAVVAFRANAGGEVTPDGIIAEMPFASLHGHLQSRARADGGMPAEPFGTLVTFWMGLENGYNGFRHEVTTYAASANCPVLLQWGELDPYVSGSEIQAVYAALPGSRKKLVSFPEAGHGSLLRSDPVLWEREVRAFLESLE